MRAADAAAGCRANRRVIPRPPACGKAAG